MTNPNFGHIVQCKSCNVTDYYPFGMVMPGRQFQSGNGYRYGFQGQEKDDEIKGEGNSINYKYRMHDPRLGRFFSIDPLAGKYPHNSPYAFSENRVIDGVELEGAEFQDYLDRLAQRAKTAAIKIVKDKVTETAAALVRYGEAKYEEFKKSLSEGNREIKVTAKVSIPVGIYGEEGFSVAGYGERLQGELIATDFVSYETGVSLTSEGLEPVNDFKFLGTDEGGGVLIRNSANVTYGVGQGGYSQEFAVTDVDGGPQGVRDKKQGYSAGAGGAAISTQTEAGSGRTTYTFGYSGGVGLGVGIRGEGGISYSEDPNN